MLNCVLQESFNDLASLKMDTATPSYLATLKEGLHCILSPECSDSLPPSSFASPASTGYKQTQDFAGAALSEPFDEGRDFGDTALSQPSDGSHNIGDTDLFQISDGEHDSGDTDLFQISDGEHDSGVVDQSQLLVDELALENASDDELARIHLQRMAGMEDYPLAAEEHGLGFGPVSEYDSYGQENWEDYNSYNSESDTDLNSQISQSHENQINSASDYHGNGFSPFVNEFDSYSTGEVTYDTNDPGSYSDYQDTHVSESNYEHPSSLNKDSDDIHDLEDSSQGLQHYEELNV